MQPTNPFRNNPLLKAETRDSDRPRRFPWAVSILFHALFAIGLLVLPGRFVRQDVQPERIDIVFYKPEVARPVPPPPVPEPLPEPLPVPQAEPVPEPPEPIAITAAAPELPPELPPVSVVARVEPPPPTPRPVSKPKPKPEPERTIARALPKPEPPRPPKPQPKPKPITGAFAKPKARPVPEARPQQVVATVGSFGAEPVPEPVREAPVPETRVVAAGSFGGGAVEVPRQSEAPDPRVVSQPSFQTAAAEPQRPRERQRSVMAAAAFNNAPDQGEAQQAHQARSISEGGFGAVENRAASSPRRSLPEADLESPVEIVSKPKPAYTDEARTRRIEGEVVLEVTFAESGELRVLRVVDGLGHGLDEAAIAAAEKIQFTPARRDGRPVDHTATLRVVFRLA